MYVTKEGIIKWRRQCRVSLSITHWPSVKNSDQRLNRTGPATCSVKYQCRCLANLLHYCRVRQNRNSLSVQLKCRQTNKCEKTRRTIHILLYKHWPVLIYRMTLCVSSVCLNPRWYQLLNLSSNNTDIYVYVYKEQN